MKIAAMAAALLCVGTVSAQAANIHLTAGQGVVISFDLPAQPAEHNGLFLFAGFTMLNGTQVKTSLLDESGMLGQTSGDYVFPLFTDPTNFHSGQPYAVDIDFSRLADGALGARLVLQVLDSVPGAFIDFETADLFGNGFGDTGTLPGYDAVITDVSPFSAVPEPTTLWLAAFGLTGALARRRLAAPASAGRGEVRRVPADVLVAVDEELQQAVRD